MRILLFGTGEYYNRYKQWFKHEQILALIDNDPRKQGTLIDGYKVISPDEICLFNYEAIFVLSFYIKEMRKQLVALGIRNEAIHHFFYIHDLIYNDSIKFEIEKYEGINMNQQKKDKKVLLLNPDLTLGGPAHALFNAAKILKENKWNVDYASQIDGPLRQYLLDEGITVIVDNNLLVQTMDECKWVKYYDLIICNTINFHVFLSKRDVSIPVIWWLHDAPFFYEGVNLNAINSISAENLSVWVVGPIPDKALKQYRPDLVTHNLIYGVNDWGIESIEEPKEYKNNDIVTFVTIGYIEKRKGQDILIDAIKQLPAEILSKCRFVIVGQNTSLLAKDLMTKCEDLDNVKFTGLLNRDEIKNVLNYSNYLICPSREDPMPTVCAEAMLHRIPCLVSDATGTSAYIRDEYDGVVFESENISKLKEKIIWCIEHRDELKMMGERAYDIYEKVFSENIFSENLLKHVEEIIGKARG